LSFIFVIVCDHFEWKRIYRLFIYVLSLEIQLSRVGCWDPIKPRHIYVSVPSQDLNFQRHKS
jgi:hypothetical protein